jgi:N-acetylmuramoyl-L-alanine amidase
MLHALLKVLLLCGLLASGLAQAVQLSATRLWPSPEYTRITLEAKQPVSYKYFILSNPDRLVIDLEGLESSAALDALIGQLSADDPFIAAIRVGMNRPGVMRLVLDLKTPVKPSVFQLQPLEQYGHRLVVDLYPPEEATETADNSATLPSGTAESAKPDQPVAAQYVRLITVAIDAGHGGEDPGASGANGSHEKDITLALAKKLKQKIDAQENMHAVLIRDGDYFIPLAQRVSKARAVKADLFLSVHADAFIKPHARGS